MPVVVVVLRVHVICRLWTSPCCTDTDTAASSMMPPLPLLIPVPVPVPPGGAPAPPPDADADAGPDVAGRPSSWRSCSWRY